MCAHSRHRRQKKTKEEDEDEDEVCSFFLRSSLLPPDAVWPAASGRATRSLTCLPASFSSTQTHLSSIFLSFLLFYLCASFSPFFILLLLAYFNMTHVRHTRLSHFIVVVVFVVVFSFVTRVWRSSYCSSALFDRSIINATPRHTTNATRCQGEGIKSMTLLIRRQVMLQMVRSNEEDDRHDDGGTGGGEGGR